VGGTDENFEFAELQQAATLAAQSKEASQRVTFPTAATVTVAAMKLADTVKGGGDPHWKRAMRLLPIGLKTSHLALGRNIPDVSGHVSWSSPEAPPKSVLFCRDCFTNCPSNVPERHLQEQGVLSFILSRSRPDWWYETLCAYEWVASYV
jgi:hypothetical protein